MRTVKAVRIGRVLYQGADGAYDAEAGLWRYPLAISLVPMIDHDGQVRPADDEEQAAILRTGARLEFGLSLEVLAGEGGAEPAQEAVLMAIGQAIGQATQAVREASDGAEVVLAYLRQVEGG
jgi:hypothetical protein